MMQIAGRLGSTSLVEAACVVAFLMVIAAWFGWSKRRNATTLFHLLVVVTSFAVADQVGTAGWTVFALVIVLAACGYAVVVIKTE